MKWKILRKTQVTRIHLRRITKFENVYKKVKRLTLIVITNFTHTQKSPGILDFTGEILQMYEENCTPILHKLFQNSKRKEYFPTYFIIQHHLDIKPDKHITRKELQTNTPYVKILNKIQTKPIQTSLYKIDKQQGYIVQQTDIYSY